MLKIVKFSDVDLIIGALILLNETQNRRVLTSQEFIEFGRRLELKAAAKKIELSFLKGDLSKFRKYIDEVGVCTRIKPQYTKEDLMNAFFSNISKELFELLRDKDLVEGFNALTCESERELTEFKALNKKLISAIDSKLEKLEKEKKKLEAMKNLVEENTISLGIENVIERK